MAKKVPNILERLESLAKVQTSVNADLIREAISVIEYFIKKAGQ